MTVKIVDDEYVSARAVMSDVTRLAFDGYQLADRDTENTVGLVITLMDGARQLGSWRGFSAVRNRQGEIAKELARPVLQAMVHFLNAGGAPADILEFAGLAEHMPQLNYRGFELAGVRDESDREVYYITDDQRVIRVFPGIMSEEVSQEELDEEGIQEDAE
jgi:hypothetical protein